MENFRGSLRLPEGHATVALGVEGNAYAPGAKIVNPALGLVLAETAVIQDQTSTQRVWRLAISQPMASQ